MISKSVLSMLVVCLIGFMAVSCSDGNDGSQNTESDDENATQKILVTKSYSFDDDCPTGKQKFTADSEEAAVNQMCEGLQDETLNGFCSQSIRAEYFSKQCEGEFSSFITSYPSDNYGEITPEAALRKFECVDGKGPVLNFVIPGFDSKGLSITLAIQPGGERYKARVDEIANFTSHNGGHSFSPTLYDHIEGAVSIKDGRFHLENIGVTEFFDPEGSKVPVMILVLDSPELSPLVYGPQNPESTASVAGDNCSP